MDLSFQEKSLAGSLVLTVVLFGWYFIMVFESLTGDTSSAAVLPFQLLWVIGIVVAVEVVYHVLIAVTEKPAETDERDRLIELKATRVSYLVLVAGCLAGIGHAIVHAHAEPAVAGRVQLDPIMTANLVLLAFILAEVVGFAVQLWYYRRGF